jgi:hypothetical protein
MNLSAEAVCVGAVEIYSTSTEILLVLEVGVTAYVSLVITTSLQNIETHCLKVWLVAYCFTSFRVTVAEQVISGHGHLIGVQKPRKAAGT